MHYHEKGTNISNVPGLKIDSRRAGPMHSTET